MNTILGLQHPDTWDTFPLFQILNDYLRTDGEKIAIIILVETFQEKAYFADNLKNGKFHQHIRDTFAPQVIRYVDLMENSIGQSIHKGFEREKWEIKG